MTRDIREILEIYKVDSNPNEKKEVIAKGKKIIEKQQLQRHSVLDLLFSTLQFISWKVWLSQFGLLFISILIILNIDKDEKIITIMHPLVALLAISVLFFMDELFRSFTHGMWELEETFKYNLSQHILLKFLIFGIVDFVIIVALSLVTSNSLALSVWLILLYLLVHYNIICIFLFLVITSWRNYLNRYLIWSVSGVVCVISFIASNIFGIYRMNLVYWRFAFVISSVILLYLIYQQYKKIFSRGVI